MLCALLDNAYSIWNLGLGTGTQLSSWGWVSITLLLFYVVYPAGHCVLYLKPWTSERGIAELMGKVFNNSAALLRCVLGWTMRTVSGALD